MEQKRPPHPVGEMDEATNTPHSPNGPVASVTPSANGHTAHPMLDLLAAAPNPLLEYMSDAFFALDQEWRLTYVNAAAERALGCQRAAVLGLRIWDAFPALGKVPLRAKLERAERDGSPVTFTAAWPPERRRFAIRAYPNVSLDAATSGLAVYFQELPARAGEAVQRAAREERLAHDLEDARRLQHISGELIREGDLDALYEQLLDAAIAVMRADMGSIQMFYPDRDALRLLAWKNFAPASAAFWEWVRVDSGSPCGEALRTGGRAIIPDVETCDFIAGTEDLEFFRLSGIRSAQTTPLLARDGHIVGMISTHWRTPSQPAERELRLLDVLARQAADLIERKQAEDASARLAAIVTSAEDAIASKTLESIVTSWNASAERMFGYTAREMIGQSIRRIIPPNRQDEEDRILAHLKAGERVEHFETVRVTKDGRPLDVSLTISPIRDCAGTIIGASKIIRDITERKRTEEALRESEEKFRTLADNIPTLAWMARADGHIFWYNRRWYDYTGTTPESQEGWGWQSVHDPDILPGVNERWQASIATGEPFEMIFPLRGADGVFRPFLTRIVPIKDERGEVVRWFGTNTNVSDLRAAEDALRAANRRMDEFLHTATHELKTPLTALQATLQLTERRVQRLLAPAPTTPGATPETASELSADGAAADHMRQEIQTVAQLLGRSLHQIRRQTRLVNDLVDAARIQADMLELRPSPCDLALIVREAVAERRAVRPERTIQLLLAEGVRVPVEADADRIDQVITNFLTNALKYSAADRPVVVTLRVEGATACVSVRDEGPGIPAEELERVWERGHRVPGIEAWGEGIGLGLGLHISRTIVEQHGGAVGVESTPGQGSTFWLTLRLAPE